MENRDNLNYKLPSETQIEQRFGASRVSVRKAFAMLESEGVIYRIKGKGTFIQRNNATYALTAKENPANCFVFIIPEVSSHFVQNICSGMLSAVQELGCKLLILSSSNSTQLERDNIATAMRLNCAGILLMPVDENHYNDSIMSLTMSHFPTLFIDRRLYGLNINCVSSDHTYIGYEATRYLLDHGHDDILFLTLSRQISSVRQRLDGYEKALDENLQSKYRKYIMFIDNYMDDTERLYNDIYRYLQDNPQITGCITNGNSNSALFLVKALIKLNKTINKDFGVVFLDDDSKGICELLDCHVPTIIQDGYRIGHSAVKMLYKFTKNGTPMEDKLIKLGNSLL